MGESLTMRRRVSEEGLRVVKLFRLGTRKTIEQMVNLSVLGKEAPANSVPAAAVIQERLTLFVVIGCKGYVDGFKLFSLKKKCNFFKMS